MKLQKVWVLLPVAMLFGCSNPADNVPKAEVSSTNASASAADAKTSSTLAARGYTFDADNSTIGWVGSKVTGSHNGGFKKFEGELHVMDGKLADAGNKVIIDTTSIWADNDRLTGHLKSPDFFNVEQMPTATFVTTSISPQGTNSIVTGNLTLHGVTKQISFPATIRISPEAVEVGAQFVINRFDFEIKYPGKANDLIRKEVVLKLKLKAAPAKA